jgi:hypothetical protein
MSYTWHEGNGTAELLRRCLGSVSRARTRSPTTIHASSLRQCRATSAKVYRGHPPSLVLGVSVSGCSIDAAPDAAIHSYFRLRPRARNCFLIAAPPLRSISSDRAAVPSGLTSDGEGQG